ncbi:MULTISPECIES: polysaccharide deacetylase family protein [Halolamina]|uniref:Polysaccharide deacetylase n=1 Tax=Halolamina pelagica TaxID=699431 RepID=A0A1I5UZ81_9EURY|nr:MULTISPECIES: hypothetical protein [Halolamina]NHX36811.1 hypothetical protein [Halolamina sp. R1-12]SFQ00541.1 hypothetical protein SAMN05216277_11540 [Halolamina pelagica]
MTEDPSNQIKGGQTQYEFTYSRYRQFLRELMEKGFEFSTYGDDVEDGEILLRHDVDLSLEKAVTMAEIEASEGVQSTYFILLTSQLYNVLHTKSRERISHIQSLGHNIGLHFSTHQYYDRDPGEEQLVEQIKDERRVLNIVTGSPIKAVSFHIPPEWILRRSFDGFVSTYEERFFSDIPYRGDSNQRWREDPPFESGYPEKGQVLVHPGLWGEDDRQFEECIHETVDDMIESVDQFVSRQYLDDELSD